MRVGNSYPAAELKRLWELVLLQQFHDILPGSSIAWVHSDAERNYAAVAGAGRSLTKAVGGGAGTGERELLLNAAPHQRRRACAGRANRSVPGGR